MGSLIDGHVYVANVFMNRSRTSFALIIFIAKAFPKPSLTLLWHSEFLAHVYPIHFSPRPVQYDQTNIPVQCCYIKFEWFIVISWHVVQFMSLSMIYHAAPPPSFSVCLSFVTCYSVSELLVCRTCFSSFIWKDKKEWVGRGWCGCLRGNFGTLPHFVFINNHFPYLLFKLIFLQYLKREEVVSKALTVEYMSLSVSGQKDHSVKHDF